MLDERDVPPPGRRRSLPGKRRRRANTDPIGPYLEALGLGPARACRDPARSRRRATTSPGLWPSSSPTATASALAERGAVDFDEQIYGAIEVLLPDGAVPPARCSSSCRHLLVDEFQDLTPAHVLLLRLLALPALDVFGVGDDDQVIYGHAGADPAFLIDFAELFPGAASHPLEVNYRCPVDGGRRAPDPARLQPPPGRRRRSWPARPPTPSRGAADRRATRPTTAASTVVDVVQGWLAEPGVAPTSIAVLTRVNSLLLAPHVALNEAGVPVARCCGPTCSSAPACGPRWPTCASPPRATPSTRDDMVEVLRRPSRGLPQWFPDRLAAPHRLSIDAACAGIADQVPDKEAAKVARLADDLDARGRRGRGGTTRQSSRPCATRSASGRR